jgi:hypothetical protein
MLHDDERHGLNSPIGEKVTWSNISRETILTSVFPTKSDERFAFKRVKNSNVTATYVVN